MGDQPRPKIIRPDTEEEERKRRAAEERARRTLRAGGGTAANVLAQKDTFGSGTAANTKLSAAAVLG